MSQKVLLSGDEAIAQAALDSGITAAFAYPGTPATEIMEYLQENIGGASNDERNTTSVTTERFCKRC